MATDNPLPRAIALDEFELLVGQTMLVDCNPRTAELVLVEAKALRHPPDAERIPYSLLFRSSPAVLLVAESYAMRCGGFGPEMVFITPVNAPMGAKPGQYYEAIFN